VFLIVLQHFDPAIQLAAFWERGTAADRSSDLFNNGRVNYCIGARLILSGVIIRFDLARVDKGTQTQLSLPIRGVCSRQTIPTKAQAMLMINYSVTIDKRLAGLLLLLASMLAGCTAKISTTAMPDDMHMPADFPAAYYQQARAAGAKVLRIDTKSSLVTIHVRRGGLLARLGHDHVVASHDVNGYADTSAGRADLYVPLQRLAVDEPALRSAAGFTTQPAESDIEGTRRNMHNKVLESASFPYALIRISRLTADRPNLSVAITLHGATHTYEVPAQIATVADGLAISGQMSINQSDFGITPFSILGGALQVQDRVDLNFRILAAIHS